MEEWKKINWNEIFEDIYSKFLEKISSLVFNIKDFNILFKLFNINKEDDIQLDFNPNSLKIMQKKFINLVSSYNGNKQENYNEDLILLIFYSELKKYNVEKFLTKYIEKDINVDIVNKVYIELLKRYKDQISPETKNIITHFFIDNPYNSN